MLILGIETSCDETAAAVVRDGSEVLSSVIASQATLHAQTGGVVPEVAARAHVEVILPVIERALAEAHIDLKQIDAIAITYGPGLASSLLTGVTVANTLATFSDKPLIGVNHILGHIRANWLEREEQEIQYPVVTLTASGGHNELVLLESAATKPKLLGETRDDAAGEAFDKVARMLDLGYPGGPAIEKIAKLGSLSADSLLPRAWLLPKDISRNFNSVEVGERLRAGRLTLTSFDFSFSGLKSEVRRRVQNKKLNQQQIANLAAEFQVAVVDVLATKLFLAAKHHQAKEIHLAGGVSANKFLRKQVQKYSAQLGITLRHPTKMSYCTDNAAMIAGAAHWLYQKTPNKYQKLKLLDVDPNLNI